MTGADDRGENAAAQQDDRSGARPARARFDVPDGVRTAAGWSWRLLLIGAAAYVLVQVGVTLGGLVLTVFAALLLTALLRPAVDGLDRRGMPRLAATWLLLLAAIGAACGVALLVGMRIAGEFQALRENLARGLQQLRDLLVTGLGIPPDRIEAITRDLVGLVGSSGGGTGVVVQTARGLLSVLAGLALALFTAFWLVYDGDRVGRWLVGLLPARLAPTGDRAGHRAWSTLSGYLRGITIVALVDAVGIGLALVVIGVPLPLTLAVLTFLGAYIPLVGATLAGLAAVLVALAAKGVTAALLTLAAVIVVQQLEGQLLHPIVMGRALTLHPLAIAYALAAGGLLYGLVGAILAVPLVAALHAVAASVAGSRRETPA